MAMQNSADKNFVMTGLAALIATAALLYSVAAGPAAANALQPDYCATLNEPGISGGDRPKKVYTGERLLLSCCLRRGGDTAMAGLGRGGLLWLAPDGSPVGHFGGSSSSDDADFVLSDLGDNGRLATALLVAPRVSPERHSGIFVCKDEETGAAASLRVDVYRRLRLTARPVQWIRQGSSGQAVCSASESGVEITWYRERHRVPNVGSSVERVQANGSKLLVARALPSDAGAYACRGRLLATTGDLEAQIDVKVVQLRVYRNPRILRGPWIAGPGNGKAVQGLTNELACLVDSWPPAQIDWLVNGRPIDFSDPASLSEFAFASRREEKSDQESPTKSVLKVFNFLGNGAASVASGLSDSAEDSAFLRPVPTFACRATLTIQEAGVLVTDMTELNPQVIYKPRITEKSLMQTSALVGASAVLSCRAQGAETADIALKFQRESEGGVDNGDSTMSGRVLLSEEKNTSYAKLKMEIKDLRPSDAGKYTCIASTLSGTAAYTGYLEVLYPPQVLEPDQSSLLFTWQQHETVLRCLARGNPPPEIAWQLNGAPLAAETPGVSTSVEKSGRRLHEESVLSELRISPPAPGAPVFGRYTCLATNRFGSVESPAILLLEARRPGTPDVDIDTTESSPTSLAFTVVPPADTGGVELIGYELHYRVNDGPEIGPAAFNLDGRIKIRYMQPQTNYKVYIAARNLAGVGGRAQINYTTGQLTPPTSFHLVDDFVSQDTRAFLLRWRILNNGGLPVDRYNIRIRQVIAEAGPDNRPIVRRVLTAWHSLNPRLPPGQMSYRIERLLPGAHYEVQVRAGNSLGLSEQHRVLVFRTPMHPHSVDVVGWTSKTAAGQCGLVGTSGSQCLLAASYACLMLLINLILF